MMSNDRLQMFDDALNYSDASYMMELCRKEQCWNPDELGQRYANLRNIDMKKCRYSNPFVGYQVEQEQPIVFKWQKENEKMDDEKTIQEKQLEVMTNISNRLSSLESMTDISHKLSCLESMASQLTSLEAVSSMNDQLSSIVDQMMQLIQDRDIGQGVKVKAFRMTEV